MEGITVEQAAEEFRNQYGDSDWFVDVRVESNEFNGGKYLVVIADNIRDAFIGLGYNKRSSSGGSRMLFMGFRTGIRGRKKGGE